jgi:hypothetical protein
MTEGKKYDSGKPRWSLLPKGAVASIVDVLEFGAKKYAENNWQLVPDGKTRYYDAAMRHLEAWHNGELNDPETGLPHLAHAGCCLMFLGWLDGQPDEIVTSGEGTCGGGGFKMDLKTGVVGAFADPAFLKDHVEKLNPGKRLDVEGQAQHTTRDDGWIEWKGGECPVDPDVMVEIKMDNDARVYSLLAKALRWKWAHGGNINDIIKYRVVK